MKIYLSGLLLFSFGLSQLQAEDKAIICFETRWSDFGNSRALERFNEAKCHFTYLNTTPWQWVCGQDINYTKKVEPELFLTDSYCLNYLYLNHIQTIARLMSVRGAMGINPSLGMKNLTYDQFRNLWLENYEKPLVQSFYENGVYIIDLTQEIGWFDHSYIGPFGPFRDDDTWHPFTTLGDVIYDPNLTVGEFKLKFHETMRALYEWKNANFPKIIFGSSLHVVSTVADTDKLMMYIKDCVDWVGEDVTGDINYNGLDPNYTSGTWEKHYLYNWVPIIEDANSTAWGTAVFESFGWKNGPEHYYGPPGTPYAGYECGTYGPFQSAMDKVAQFDGANHYLKLLMYTAWMAHFEEYPYLNNPYTILSYPDDLGTLPPWDPVQLSFPYSYTLTPLYNRWGDTMPHPSDDPAYSSFVYVRDVMHADSNPYWDNCPRYPLVVTREGIAVDPDTGKIHIRLRNLCAPGALSANVHVYQTPPGITPWDRSAYKKASPDNIRNSLQSAYEIAFIPAGSFSVPGNGHLDTDNNVVELEVSSSLPLENGKNIHIFIEDSDTVKGWTACNDIPVCNDFTIDGDGYYKFDFYPPGTSIGDIYLRARTRDIFGACSRYTDALQVEKRYKLNLTCNAFDNDGVNEIEYQYSDDGISWYDVPRQKYYCLTANDKEFKQNSRFTTASTDMGHYPVIENISGAPLKGVVPLSVNFNVAASDPVGAITSIEWDFNRDGIIDATGADVSWTYTQVGAYNAIVKVTNNEGYSSFSEIKVEALNGSPIAVITAVPQSGSAPLTVQFQGNGTDYDGTIVAYAWDFTNDGVIDSTARNPSFIYPQVGNYTARLTVTDNSNLTGSATVSINVADPNSIAACAIIASATEGETPLTVSFSADISGGGVVSAYAWDFNNDGVIDSSEAAPSITYNLSGLYTVKLIVTDINGHSVTDYEYIIVKAGGLPAADFTFSPASGVAPLEVNFQAVASDPDGAIVSYRWDFGDCTYSGQETPPPHVYALNNQYLARLTVTDNDGNEVTVRKTVAVESGLGKLYGDGNGYEDIAVNQDRLTGGYYTYSAAPDVFGEECGRTAGTPIYFRGQDGNIGGNTNAHGDLTDGNFGYGKGEGVMWSGGFAPEITFDLQGKYALNNIEIWQDPNSGFESVTCYLSQDGVAWDQIGSFDSTGQQKVHLDLRNYSARKVRLAFNNTDSSNAYLAEIQIWGTPFEESTMDWVDDFEYGASPEEHGWQIYSGSGAVGTEYDDLLKSNVMRVNSPDGWNFGVIRRPTDDPQKSYADLNKRYFSYTIKSEGTVWVYVLVHGDDNQWYYLVYRPVEGVDRPGAAGYVSGMYVYYSLPIVYEGNQNWNTISRDLEGDLFTATGHHLKDVGLVFIRGGNYRLDDLSFSSSAPPTLNWGLFKDGVMSSNGSMLKVMDYELGREVIKAHSQDWSLFAIMSEAIGINKKWAHFNFKTTAGMEFRILVKGSDSRYYYLSYLPATGSYAVENLTGCQTVYHYLGEDTMNGQWVDVYRDLDRDLYVAWGVHLEEVTYILTRGGDYRLNMAEFSEEPFNKIEIPLNYGWDIFAGTGTVASVYDSDLQSQVMETASPEGWNFGIYGPELGAGYIWTDARHLSFMIKPSEQTWMEVIVQGEDGLLYYLQYHPEDGACNVDPTGTRITHNLGSDLVNGQWHYVMRDLDKDLIEGVGLNVKNVLCFIIRGGGYSLDNLTLDKDAPAEISVPASAADWFNCNQYPWSGDAQFTNYYDSAMGSQALQINSAGGQDWYCLSLYPNFGYLDVTKHNFKLNLKSNSAVGLRFYIYGLDARLYQIIYITDDGVDAINSEYAEAYIYLGSESKNGAWHGISLNLEKDLYEKFGQHLDKTIKIGIHGGNVAVCNLNFTR